MYMLWKGYCAKIVAGADLYRGGGQFWMHGRGFSFSGIAHYKSELVLIAVLVCVLGLWAKISAHYLLLHFRKFYFDQFVVAWVP